MPLPTCQQYRALKGLDLALHVLLDDAHEARAAALAPLSAAVRARGAPGGAAAWRAPFFF